MDCSVELENSKYKLLGFENGKSLAVIMVIATGKIIKIKLSEVLNSEIMDNLNKIEVKTSTRSSTPKAEHSPLTKSMTVMRVPG